MPSIDVVSIVPAGQPNSAAADGLPTVQPSVQSFSSFSIAPMKLVTSKNVLSMTTGSTKTPVVETLMLASISACMAATSSPSTTVVQSKLTPPNCIPVPS